MGNRLWWNVNSNIVFVLTNKAISKAKAIILVCRNRFKQENEPIMQMWTSELAMSEFTSPQYIGDIGNQSDSSQHILSSAENWFVL